MRDYVRNSADGTLNGKQKESKKWRKKSKNNGEGGIIILRAKKTTLKKF